MYIVPILGSVLFDPLDSTEYLVGLNGPDTDAARAMTVRFQFPGIIVGAHIRMNRFGGEVPSTEDVTIQVTNDVGTAATPGNSQDIGLAGPWNVSSRIYESNSLSLPTSPGGTNVGLRINTPAWVTNPTQVRIEGLLWITDDAEEARTQALEDGGASTLTAEEVKDLRSTLGLRVSNLGQQHVPLLTRHGQV